MGGGRREAGGYFCVHFTCYTRYKRTGMGEMCNIIPFIVWGTTGGSRERIYLIVCLLFWPLLKREGEEKKTTTWFLWLYDFIYKTLYKAVCDFFYILGPASIFKKCWGLSNTQIPEMWRRWVWSQVSLQCWLPTFNMQTVTDQCVQVCMQKKWPT